MRSTTSSASRGSARWAILGTAVSLALATVPVASLALESDCGPGDVTTGERYVAKNGAALWAGPGPEYGRIVDEKASSPDQVVYDQFYGSTTVLEVCRRGAWSRVEVAEPAYLRGTHRGWVESSFLRKSATDSAGRRIYVREDFTWDDERTWPYKDVIVAAANRVSRENNNCEAIDGADYAITRSKPGEPVFYVMCRTKKDEPFNVFFAPDDIESKKSMAVTHLDKGKAIATCMAYAKSIAAHPSTVNFPIIGGMKWVKEHPNGRTSVDLHFSARNAFNLEVGFDLSCLLDSTGLLEAHVAESR